MLDAAAAQGMVDAAGIRFSVDGCVRLPGGDNSAAYELVDEGRGRRLVAKVYGERMVWKLGKEVLVYGLLEQVPVPTPRILFAGHGYALLTRLPGAPAVMVAIDVAGVWRQIGAAARAIHQLTFDRFGYIGPEGVIDPVATNRAHMVRILENHVRAFRNEGGEAAVVAAVERRFAADEPLLDRCGQAVLCHDDLHEENVLVEERAGGWTVTGIVDVENASAADPMLDLAKADYYAKEDAVRRAAMLDGYGPLPPDGEARMALYRLHHALALWCWFSRVGRAGPLPGLAADVARLAATR